MKFLIVLAILAVIVAVVLVYKSRNKKKVKPVQARIVEQVQADLAAYRRVREPKPVAKGTPVRYSGGVAKPQHKRDSSTSGYVAPEVSDTSYCDDSSYSSGGYSGGYSSGYSSGSSSSSDSGSSSSFSSDSGSSGGGCD